MADEYVDFSLTIQFSPNVNAIGDSFEETLADFPFNISFSPYVSIFIDVINDTVVPRGRRHIDHHGVRYIKHWFRHNPHHSH